MPPAPSGAMISYGPNRVFEANGIAPIIHDSPSADRCCGAGNLAQCHILFATRIKQVLGPEHLRPFQRPNCLLERRKTGEKRVAATQAATQSTQISSLLYLRCKKYVAAGKIGCPTKQADLPIDRRFANPPHKSASSSAA